MIRKTQRHGVKLVAIVRALAGQEKNISIVAEHSNLTQRRQISKVYRGMPTTDGAGVKLTRMLGTPELEMIDPFLMLDRMDSDDPNSYIAGFPNHPHRGFETVTIMHAGQMRHHDSVGNSGLIKPGDVQWMTAGRGIIHSEIPEMLEGRMSGFQLWVNLPAKHKMVAPKYQDLSAKEIPTVKEQNCSVRVIRGSYGKVVGPAESLMPVRILDVDIGSNASWQINVDQDKTNFVCVYEGSIKGPDLNNKIIEVNSPSLILFDGQGEIRVNSNNGSNFLYCEGQPLHEPIARYGPFVMNTHSEIRQAVDDYNNGVLAV